MDSIVAATYRESSNHACMQLGGIISSHYPARSGTVLLLNPPPCFPILQKARMPRLALPPHHDTAVLPSPTVAMLRTFGARSDV